MNEKDREDINQPDFSSSSDDDESSREEGMPLNEVLAWLSEADYERNAVDKELRDMLSKLK